MASHITAPLHFPHPEAPPNGGIVEVAPGVRWFRLPLPFSLDHINVYLIEDNGGWAVLDTGIDDQITRDAWEAALAGPLAGTRLTRVIATHFHPDHIGLVGWLTERFGLPLAMSRTEYFFAQTLRANSDALRSAALLLRTPAQLNTWIINFVSYMNNEGEATWRDFLSKRVKK